MQVADFGLSRKINTRMSKLPGNRFYMAPEVLTGTSEYSIEMDIVRSGCACDHPYTYYAYPHLLLPVFPSRKC